MRIGSFAEIASTPVHNYCNEHDSFEEIEGELYISPIYVCKTYSHMMIPILLSDLSLMPALDASMPVHDCSFGYDSTEEIEGKILLVPLFVYKTYSHMMLYLFFLSLRSFLNASS